MNGIAGAIAPDYVAATELADLAIC
jgi:hypothetical protein